MSTPMYQKAQVTSHLKTVACVQSNRCVGVHPSRMIFRAGRRDAEDREDLPITPWPHDPVVELCHRRARAPVRDAAERAAARRVATPARLAAVPVAGGPYDLRHHHHLAVHRHRHDLGLPVHRLRLHDGEAARTYILRGEDHGLGGRLNDCYGLGGRLHDCYGLGGRLHDCYGLGGRLNDCSLDDGSLDDRGSIGLSFSLKFWREARRLLGLHRVGAATGRTPRRSLSAATISPWSTTSPCLMFQE